MTNATNKGRWLDELLVELGWTSADLARAAGLDSAVISNIRNGKRGTGFDTALKIAKATKRPEEEIYRRAGLLSPALKKSELIDRILHELDDLPPSEKQNVLEYIQLRWKQLKKK